MNINLVKINNKLSKIESKISTLNFKNILVPFKLSNYNNKYYLTIELNQNDLNNKNILEDYKLLESELFKLKSKNEDLENLDFYSNIKTKSYKNNNLDLIRLHIKKSKNTILTKIEKKNGEATIFEIEEQKRYNCKIEINNLWINKNKYGVILNLLHLQEI